MAVDVTIIGSGMAAVAAAVEALAHGARVTVVRGRPGATALSSGAWDIAGDPMRLADRRLEEIPSPAQSLKELIRRKQHHPYTVMAQNPAVEDLPFFLSKGIERVASALEIRLRGGVESPFVCLTPIGTVRPTAYVGRGLEAGNLRDFKEARPLVAGLKGLSSFSATLAATFLRPLFKQTQSTEIRLEAFPSVISPIDGAQRLDEDKTAAEFSQKLAEEARRLKPTHIVLPPVIGLERHDHLLSLLFEATGLPCFETLGLPPSVPGLRLQKSIDRMLSRGGIHLIDGEAVGFEKEGRRIGKLLVKKRNEAPSEAISVDRVLLATGRYLGGGIIKDGSFCEPLLDLPVFSDGVPVKKVFVGKMLAPSALGEHPLFAVGVRVTRNLQPVDENGRLAFENLWAAGSVIAGSNPAVEQCGLGVAIGTGTLAGRIAIQ